MPIYTKTGDGGTTSLYGNQRLLKSDSRVRAYGSIDELSSFIGLVASISKKNKNLLFIIQKDLYQIMSSLGGAKADLFFIENRVNFFEKTIDMLTKKSPPLKNFILPSGTTISCWFHILRTVCRRTERTVFSFFNQPPITNHKSPVIKYLNRLSDLFFTLARHYNYKKEVVIIK